MKRLYFDIEKIEVHDDRMAEIYKRKSAKHSPAGTLPSLPDSDPGDLVVDISIST
ncbi:hypothetical protein IIA15_00720 [candidate division TA06 bacterium]|nr:hypothetical protein [candidate division TA06 bacterium]